MLDNNLLDEFVNNIENLAMVMEKVDLVDSSIVINKHNIENMILWRGDAQIKS